jgi:tetratricopeptide (TPR) repeat protein
MRSRVLLIFLVFVFLSEAYAGPKEDAVAQKKRGDNLMEEGNYEEALKAFEEAKRIMPDASIELSLAGVLLKLRRFEDAKASYQAYLNSGKAKQQNQKKIKGAISDIESTLKTSLRCESEPIGAKVFLNSRIDGYLGETPLNVNLPPGEHRVFFEREGFQLQVERLSVKEGDQASLKVTMTALPFLLSIESIPSAEIFLDGVSRGVTPQTLEVPKGKYSLLLSLEGYEPINESVEGSLGQQVIISKTLIAKPSTLKFEILPARAQVRIKGRAETFQANSTIKLPPGEYVAVATALGFEEKSSTIRIGAGKEEALSLSLTPNAGTLLIKAQPGAKISTNDQRLEANQLNALPPGSYTLKIEAAGYPPLRQEVSVQLGVKTIVDVVFSTGRSRTWKRRAWYSATASVALGGVAILLREAYRQNELGGAKPDGVERTPCGTDNGPPLSVCITQSLSTTAGAVAIGSFVISKYQQKFPKSAAKIQEERETQ